MCEVQKKAKNGKRVKELGWECEVRKARFKTKETAEGWVFKEAKAGWEGTPDARRSCCLDACNSEN